MDEGSEYRRVLKEWAGGLLREDLGAVEILEVDPYWYRGFGGSDVTPADEPEFSLRVRYRTADGDEMTYVLYDQEDNAIKLGELLRQLFAIAEKDRS